MSKCPYCRRKLREHEVYCDFCEQDTTKLIKRTKKKTSKPETKKRLKPYYEQMVQSPPKLKIKKEPKFIAYCVKCRKKVTVKNPKDYTMKNKRLAIKGVCPFCATKVFRILGMKKKKK